MAPPSAALGTWVALSTATGGPRPGVPQLDGPVEVVEPDGGGGYYLAGRFTNAGRGGLAHIRSDGTNDPAFAPEITVPVNVPRLVRVGASLVVGGLTGPLSALDPVTGATSPWVPALPSAYVGPMVGAGGRLFVMTSDGLGDRRVTAFDGTTGGVVWTSPVVGDSGGFADFSSGAMTAAGSRLIVFIGRLYALDAATGAIDPSWGGPDTPSSSSRVDVMAVHGSTIYLAGSFTTLRGQPRRNLAAVDLASGNLLPWNPDASRVVQAMAVAPDGTVFAQALGTIGGINRGAVMQIDATGAPTSWAPQPRVQNVASLAIAANGDLLVSSYGNMLSGTTARAGLAAFDLATGTLLPAAPIVSGLADLAVVGVAARGTILYLRGTFTAVNGQPRVNAAAVDVTSGTVLPWPAAGVLASPSAGLRGWQFVLGNWIYGYLDASQYGPLRRIHVASGAIDPAWQAAPPPGGGLIVTSSGPEIVAVERLSNLDGLPAVLRMGTLDLVTGMFIERSRTRLTRSDGTLFAIAVDGDTVYVADPSWSAYSNNTGALRAIDAATGRDVQVPAVSGQVSAVSVVDGRLFPTGARFSAAGTPRDYIAEVARPGAATAWRVPGPATVVPNRAPQVLGDVMVLAATDSGFDRVFAFDLTGLAAPANVSARPLGDLTEFSWTPAAGAASRRVRRRRRIRPRPDRRHAGRGQRHLRDPAAATGPDPRARAGRGRRRGVERSHRRLCRAAAVAHRTRRDGRRHESHAVVDARAGRGDDHARGGFGVGRS